MGSSSGGGENTIIANCYNNGKITAIYRGATNKIEFSGGIQGGFWYGVYKTDIKHCYYNGTKSDRSVGATNSEYAQKLTYKQINGSEKFEDEEGMHITLVEELNTYKEIDPDELETNEWCNWIQNSEGYPDLEIE